MLTKRDKHLAAAQRLLERGQPDRALEELAQVAEADPSDSRTRLKMAEIHAQRGNLPGARDIYLATADIYLAQGFLDKATTIYKSQKPAVQFAASAAAQSAPVVNFNPPAAAQPATQPPPARP